jgi:hypothetical protein
MVPVFINGERGLRFEPGLPLNRSAGLHPVLEMTGTREPQKDGARRHCHVVPGQNVLPDRQGGGADRFSRPAPDCGQPLRIRPPLPAFLAEVLRPRP